MAQRQPLAISPPPGVVLTETNKAVAGRWVAPWDKVRFYRGRPEKRGGRARVTTVPTSGLPRTSLAWTDLLTGRYVAVGTYRKLYVYDPQFVQNDVTPFRRTSGGIGGGAALTNPFATTTGSSLVTVTDNGNGVAAGDTVIFTSVQSAAGSITALQLTSTFLVTQINDANHYVFDCGVVQATGGNPTGGGTVQYEYEINTGTEFQTFGLGWGVGPYGLGTYGTPRANSTIVFDARVWSFDAFGKLLMATYNGGSIYQFDPTQAQPWPRAVLASADAQAPTDCLALFVTPERFVFALRAGLNVSWCSQGDPTTWTPTTNNTANTRTLAVGNKLVAGRVLAPFISGVWTDAAFYLFQYTGTQFIYESSLVGKDCGLMSPNAAVSAGGITYWMAQNNFFMYDGSVHPMPNVDDIRRVVFDSMDPTLDYQAHAYYNPLLNEIEFYWGVVGAASPTNYIAFSIDLQVWWPGTWNHCSGTHFVNGDDRPYVGASDGHLYQLENTNDDNGAPLAATLTLSPYAVGKGMSNLKTESLVMDLKNQIGPVTTVVNAFDELSDAAPIDTATVVSPAANAGRQDMIVTGRYLALSVTQAVLGGRFRWGEPVVWAKQKGTRR